MYLVSKTSQTDYIGEHLDKAKNALSEIEEGLKSDNAVRVIDGLSALQWQERSLIVGVKRMMESLGITEEAAGVQPILEYKGE
jgi:hypothetical protein